MGIGKRIDDKTVVAEEKKLRHQAQTPQMMTIDLN